MTALGITMREVAVAHREELASANVLARVRTRLPVRRSLGARLAGRLPALRFALPALAAIGGFALYVALKPASLSFVVGDAAVSGGVNTTATGTLGQALEATANHRVPLAFSDGSQVTLTPGARVRVAALDSRGATLQIERGRAEVSVRHRRHTHWQLRAGSFEVTVTGTRFSIDWDEHARALGVVMTEGSVEVRGQTLHGDSPIVVSAGQQFHATAGAAHWTLAPAGAGELEIVAAPASASDPSSAVAGPSAAAPAVVPLPPPGEAPSVSTTPPARAGARSLSWQALARAGHYEEALQIVERSGFSRACRRFGSEDLVQLGDAARLARRTALAEQAYQAARRRFPTMDRPVFAMGLVAFEQKRDFRGAAKWFETYARRYPNGPLAREAVGREMESWHRAGDGARARRAAHAYLDQAPQGPYAPLARQISAP